MTADEVARVFDEMADLLELRGHDPHRARAFRTTARKLKALRVPLEQALASGELERTKGIGEGSISRIKEIARTGSCDAHRRLLATVPAGVRGLLELKGLGPATVRRLYQQHRLESVDALDRALRTGPVAGIDAELAASLLAHIDRRRRNPPPLLLDEALRRGREVLALLDAEPSCDRAIQAGSVRRGKPMVKDLDVLIASDAPEQSIRAVLEGLDVEERYTAGETRASVRLAGDVQLDLRALPLPSWGAGLHYFTGSGAHNIALRKRANARGLGLSDHGLRRLSDDVLLTGCPREEDVFVGLGLPFIAPELREDAGELERAEEGRLPALVEERHVATDGWLRPTSPSALRPLVDGAERRGLRCVLVGVPLSATRAERTRFVDEASRAERATGLAVRLALEVPLDDADAAARELEHPLADVEGRVIGLMPRGQATATAAQLELIARGGLLALAQVSGRVLPNAPRVRADVDAVLRAMAKGETALMVSGHPAHLDADDGTIRLAGERGVSVLVGSEASAPDELWWLELALLTARRGWCSPGRLLRLQGASEALTATGSGRAADLDPALMSSLVAPALDDATLGRVQRYLLEGEDPALEACLSALGPNPLQVAYTLSLRAGPQILDPDE